MLSLSIIALFGFVEHELNDLPCHTIEIKIDQSNEIYFIDKNDIMEVINSIDNSIIGKPIGKIDIFKLEKIINRNPFVEKSNVYKTLNGELTIEVKQRTPLLRVFSMAGESYYIDKQGYFMPLSDKYTARVPIVSGYIFEKYAPNAEITIYDIIKNDSIASKTTIDDVFLISEFITKNEFWNAQIDQIYVNIDRDIELIPRVGSHIIMFGNAENLEEKFENLMIFYHEALPKVGWNEYKYINLKYKDQIICSK
jgi:cell division protein FtsQ